VLVQATDRTPQRQQQHQEEQEQQQQQRGRRHRRRHLRRHLREKIDFDVFPIEPGPLYQQGGIAKDALEFCVYVSSEDVRYTTLLPLPQTKKNYNNNNNNNIRTVQEYCQSYEGSCGYDAASTERTGCCRYYTNQFICDETTAYNHLPVRICRCDFWLVGAMLLLLFVFVFCVPISSGDQNDTMVVLPMDGIPPNEICHAF
jgi:hypothetical protein